MAADDAESARWVEEGKRWCAWDPNEVTRAEVAALVAAADGAALRALLEERMVFGTSGLRASMGPGVVSMNDLTVLQISQAMCAYVLAECGEARAREHGVVIGYDHRELPSGALSSERFAHFAAAAFAHKDVRVILLEGAVATPLVPFAILRHGACAGVMVTASHNPPRDNGYKVYWGNGSQIVPPHDAGIAAHIDSTLEPWGGAYARVGGGEGGGVRSLPAVARGHAASGGMGAIADAYHAAVASKLCRFRAHNGASPLRVCYTPLHGVGAAWVERAWRDFGHPPYTPVAEQLAPDPAFPTLPFPNPEEAGALDLAMRAAEAAGASLIVANDPDADRLGVAERRGDAQGGGWRLFKGDEIGVLLAVWEWQQLQARRAAAAAAAGAQPPAPPPRPAAVVASTVSSKMLRAIAAAEGFRFEECLTGFKWIGNTVDRLRCAEGHDVFFSYEESIGFCVGDIVNDKDGIMAAACFVEMAEQLRRGGQSVGERMDELCERFGYFCTNNSYYKCYDAAKTERIFARLRNGGAYATHVGEYEIASVRDLTTGHDSSQPDGRATLPVSSATQMLTYEFANGCVATLRTSGTEPKLKYYIELPGLPGQPREVAQAAVDAMATVLVEEWLQPALNQLEPPVSS